MTYEDIYDEFCKKFPNAEAQDYRPAVEMHIPQLSRGIPNAIIVWLKDGSKIIYMAESERSKLYGLAEEIRCAMCTNVIKSDSGCDGGCQVDEDMYKRVIDTIENHIGK